MMFPVIFDWMRLEELLANAFCRSDIIASPGIRNATLDGERRAAAEREIAWLPCGEDELSALARGRFATDVKFREEQRIRWTEEARDHYARAAALAAGARK